MTQFYYTYAYLREDRTPYYIGKGTGYRVYKKSRREFKPPKDKSRIIFLKQNLTEEEAFKHERYMIALFGRKGNGTGILRNMTDGGEGASGVIVSNETRNKMSEVTKKWQANKTPEQRSEAIRKGQANRTPEQKSEIGRKGGIKSSAQKFQCTVTGFITNAGGLSMYQKARGIDTSNRVRVS